jgi:serine protease Do
MSASLLGIARQFSAGMDLIVHALRDVVVQVRCGGLGMGTGITWGNSGLVITSAHVVLPSVAVEVEYDGRWRPARLLACERSYDIALLACADARGPLLDIRDPESLRSGELVFAHGHPLGVRDALAMGVLHGVARNRNGREPRWIMADVRLAPGNSGGPLVDADGKLLGINSMVVNGMGFAVPATLAQRVVDATRTSRAA